MVGKRKCECGILCRSSSLGQMSFMVVRKSVLYLYNQVYLINPVNVRFHFSESTNWRKQQHNLNVQVIPIINDNYATQSASAANKPSWNMQSRQRKDVMHHSNSYNYSKYWEDFATICCFVSIGDALAFKWLQHYVGLLQWQNTLMA